MLAFSVATKLNANQSPQPKDIQTVAKVESRSLTSGEKVRIQKLIRDMNNVLHSIPDNGPSIFQEPEQVKKYQKRFGQFTDALKRYNQFPDPIVNQARQIYSQLQRALSTEFKRANDQKNSLGDVQAQLKMIESTLFSYKAPDALSAPFGKPKADAWVLLAAKVKRTAKESIEKIQTIDKAANLAKNNPGTVQQGALYDKQDINRLMRYANSQIQKIDKATQTTMDNLKSNLAGVRNELDYFRNLDPKNPSHKANAFLKEDASERIHGQLDKKLAIAKSAAFFMLAFGQPPSEGIQSLINEINGLKKSYSKKQSLAIGENKLPNAKSDDSSLTQIAKNILDKKQYQFGEHGPIVLTSKGVIDQEREESEERFTDIDVSLSGDITLHGTKTTWNYRWKEFKFAAPILDKNGDWYVWWITARKFSSGGSKTPIEQWVAGRVVKGSMILKDNF